MYGLFLCKLHSNQIKMYDQICNLHLQYNAHPIQKNPKGIGGNGWT